MCLIAPVTSLGQEGQDIAGSKIEILKLKWEKQVRLPRNFDPSIIPASGAFSDPARSTASAASNAPAGGLPATQSNPYVTFPAMPGRLPVSYGYSMKIKNVGARAIEGIAWDYLFIDPNSKKEIGRHQFLSYEKVPTNKSVTLHAQLRSPPVRLVLAPDAKKNQSPKFVERAVIQCVLYSDDTFWQSPQVRSGVCDLLTNNRSILKRRHVVVPQ